MTAPSSPTAKAADIVAAVMFDLPTEIAVLQLKCFG